jgi:hypothetical protein
MTMDYSQKRLHKEIADRHQYLAKEDGAAPKSWLVEAVMLLHNEDRSDFAEYCSHAHVSAEVDRYIRRLRELETDGSEDQLLLEGWDHLQVEYVLTRDEESVIVRIDCMTFDEREAKAAQHDAWGMGHFQHARELRRYNELCRSEMAE